MTYELTDCFLNLPVISIGQYSAHFHYSSYRSLLQLTFNIKRVVLQFSLQISLLLQNVLEVRSTNYKWASEAASQIK